MKLATLAEFQADCLRLIDDVHSTRQPLVITRRGNPIAKLVPVDELRDLIGRLKGVFDVAADLDRDPPEPWESAV